jgi:hypothetical protein
MPISERDYWRDEGASWMYEPDEIEARLRSRERPGVG